MERRGEKSPENSQASSVGCLPQNSPNPAAGGELLLCTPSPPLPSAPLPSPVAGPLTPPQPGPSAAPRLRTRPRTGCLLDAQAARGSRRRAGGGIARGTLALLLLPGKAAPQPRALRQQQAAAASALGTPLDEDCFYQPDAQTYSAVAGDVTLSLQPLQVVLAFVVGPQMRVMQAVVVGAQQAAVWISQIEIARGPVKL